MRPMRFMGYNKVAAEHQPPYDPLPIFHVPGQPYGIVTSCWGLTWRERLRVLFTGAIWVQQMTFDRPIQPMKLTVEPPSLSALASSPAAGEHP